MTETSATGSLEKGGNGGKGGDAGFSGQGRQGRERWDCQGIALKQTLPLVQTWKYVVNGGKGAPPG